MQTHANTVYRNATLFTAENEAVITDGALWVNNGIIRYAGPTAGLPDTPADTTFNDLNGHFLMPLHQLVQL